MKQLYLYTDGGARGNPGPAGAGISLRAQDGDVVWEGGIFLGERTNNQAEYIALYKGVEKAAAMDAKKLHCYLDSELIVKQLNGEYKIKDATLKEIAEGVRKVGKHIDMTFEHIPRLANKVADSLANLAMDKGSRIGETFVPNPKL